MLYQILILDRLEIRSEATIIHELWDEVLTVQNNTHNSMQNFIIFKDRYIVLR